MNVVLEVVAAFITTWLVIDQLKHLTASITGFGMVGIILILIIAVGFLILAFICGGLTESVGGLYCSIPLVLMMLALGIFMLAVSSQGGGMSVPGRSYKKYQLESYSNWMQNKVNSNWDHYYKKDIIKNKNYVCAIDHDQYFPVFHRFPADPAFQTGCCEAPRDCRLCGLKNHTRSLDWKKQEDDEYNYCSDDCKRWDNDPNTLCFDCESCKAGFLQDLTKVWFRAGLILVILGVIILCAQIIVAICILNFDPSAFHYKALLPSFD